MSRFRSKRRSRDRLFRRVHRKRVKYIAILPSLITLLNGLFGFMAIVFASQGVNKDHGGASHFLMAGYMVLLAMFADMLDGRLARMSQSTSSFGGQLDSLCDMVSFGIAPAFLILKTIEGYWEVATPLSGDLRHRFIWLATLAYISCTAIRLARFNVENEEDESAHMSFIGLPSPAAAGVLISAVIFVFHHEILPDHVKVLIYLFPALMMGVALLMVSRIQYPHILNLYLRGKKPFSYLIRVLFFFGVIIWGGVPLALVLMFGFFTCSGLARWLYGRVITRKRTLPAPEADSAGPLPGNPEPHA